MDQAILPFLEYCVLQIAVAIVGLNVVKERDVRFSIVLKTWIMGQMLLCAVLQVMAVPMVLLHWKFDVLFWSYMLVFLVLFGFGIRDIKKRQWKISTHKNEWNWLAIVLLIITVALILWQAGNYYFGMHLDEDDARWLAEANDALEYGDMMNRHYYTGEYWGSFPGVRDATSPWPLMWAIWSRILFTRASIFTHTILPPIEVMIMYGIFWLIGCELLKKIEARLCFLLAVAMIYLFVSPTSYNQSTFSLIRIWQGKATVAGIIIPALFYLFVCLYKKDNIYDWINVIVVGCAGCLLSGMGIILPLIMIGIYGAYNILVFQRWRRIPIFLVSLVPSLLFALLHYYLKG